MTWHGGDQLTLSSQCIANALGEFYSSDLHLDRQKFAAGYFIVPRLVKHTT